MYSVVQCLPLFAGYEKGVTLIICLQIVSGEVESNAVAAHPVSAAGKIFLSVA